MLPSAVLTLCSLDTEPLAADVTPAIGPVRLSIMFITRESLNTDSKLMLCLLPYFVGRRPCALSEATAARSFREDLGDCPGDDVLLELLDEASLRNVTDELVKADRLEIKTL